MLSGEQVSRQIINIEDYTQERQAKLHRFIKNMEKDPDFLTENRDGVMIEITILV